MKTEIGQAIFPVLPHKDFLTTSQRNTKFRSDLLYTAGVVCEAVAGVEFLIKQPMLAGIFTAIFGVMDLAVGYGLRRDLSKKTKPKLMLVK